MAAGLRASPPSLSGLGLRAPSTLPDRATGRGILFYCCGGVSDSGADCWPGSVGGVCAAPAF